MLADGAEMLVFAWRGREGRGVEALEKGEEVSGSSWVLTGPASNMPSLTLDLYSRAFTRALANLWSPNLAEPQVSKLSSNDNDKYLVSR